MANELITTVQELVAAREARGLGADDVQRQLKLHARQVHAIEEGDWSALPGMPFVRGTLRNYAKLLDVDVTPLLQSISTYGKPVELRASSTLEEPLRSSAMFGFGNGGSGSGWIWALLGLGGVVALAMFFGRDGDLSRIPSWFTPIDKTVSADAGRSGDAGTKSEAVTIAPLPAPVAGAAPTTAGPAAASPAAGGDSAVASAAVPAAGAIVAAPAPVAQAEAAPVPAPAAALPANVERVSLAAGAKPEDTVPMMMSFDAETWIEIRTQEGKLLFTGNQKGNSTILFATKGPIAIVIARPEKVKLEYDGKPVPVKPAPGSMIAKLKLPQ